MRASLLYSPLPGLEVLARVHYEDREQGGYNYADPVGKPEFGLVTGDYEVALLTPEFRDEEMTIASLRIDWELDIGKFTSVTSWYERDIDARLDWAPEFKYDFFGFYYPARGDIEQEQQDISQELRLSSHADADLQWLLGLYYLDQDYDTDGKLLAEGIHEACPGCFPFIRENGEMLDEQRETTREDLALFGELSFPLGEELTATLGARWYDTEQDRDVEGYFMFAPVLDDSVSGDTDGMVYKAALAWEPRPELMLYALAASGFRPGQFNDSGPREQCGAEPLLDSDELWNYEVGARSEWFQRRLMVNLTAFYIDWTDIQTSTRTPDCPFPILDNAGEASSLGFELEYSAVFSEWLSIDGSVGYNEAELEDDNPGFNAEAGDPLPNVPEWTASIAANISYPVTRALTGYTRLEAQYVDSRPTVFNREEAMAKGQPLEIDSYSLVNLRSGIEWRQWRAELFADNLLDEEADLFCCRLRAETTVNRPRTIGLRAVLDY